MIQLLDGLVEGRVVVIKGHMLWSRQDQTCHEEEEEEEDDAKTPERSQYPP